MDEIRIGKVSSVSGNFIKVTYPDRQDSVTAEFPVIANGVYRIPSVGENVVTAHLSNGNTNGFIIGCLAGEGSDMALAVLNSVLQDHEKRIEELEAKV